MWDLIVSVPDHCLSFYFSSSLTSLSKLVESLASAAVMFLPLFYTVL